MRLSLDAHKKYATPSHSDVQPRFVERFFLSLRNCPTFLAADDTFKLLKMCAHNDVRDDGVRGVALAEKRATKEDAELDDLKADLGESASCVALCATLCQARALMSFLSLFRDSRSKKTLALTSARGRGKSAAVGLMVAEAVGDGASRIVVCAPKPER